MVNWKKMLLLVLLLIFQFNVFAEELKAKELAQALGVDWWTVSLPSGKGRYSLFFEAIYPDGKIKRTGRMGGIKAGEKFKIFCYKGKNKRLRFSAVSHSAICETSILSPFVNVSLFVYPIAIGGNAKSASLLKKGTINNSVSSDNIIKKGEVGIRMIIEKEK